MGIFSDIKAMSDVQKIKSGGTASLSIASITTMIINTMDANKNLSQAEYREVQRVFNQMRRCTTKIKMDYDTYILTCIDILKEFDKVAPCEYYLGLEPFEASLIMKEVRR